MQTLLRKLFVFLLLFNFFSAIADEPLRDIVRGKVTDSKTGEPLIGATVTLISASKTYTNKTALDGFYQFKNIPSGKYTIKVEFVGYDNFQSTVDFTNGTNNLITDNIKIISNCWYIVINFQV